MSQNSAELDKHLAFLEDQEGAFQCAEIPADLQQAAEIARKYLNATKLDRDMVLSFVDSIYLYDDDHYEIVWKFKDLFHQFKQEISQTSLPAQNQNKEERK